MQKAQNRRYNQERKSHQQKAAALMLDKNIYIIITTTIWSQDQFWLADEASNVVERVYSSPERHTCCKTGVKRMAISP
ncbi:hypothetical protein [Citrobacter amalonaticus]|uniref:hypothetical protein n=1 Tax=Citrobacter amalonaticus TaxID=35703 RepID=UPI0011AF108B|nr:hypothetical protein [Citrobacter amalonaticus]